ncbi:hypothetical protein LX16_3445 [Stackebrandtia albiflava]|uniref:Uncharacterized protein n=1 Tax=Stackebrandtia albiflava TaxID=406432 RepID=A0A562V4C1_9ACTN|nr:hypothetical protein [Stackebrandtia albiflava]TWJ12682.1 hypothetical protein LX16_3445 [Stackebrandtia albiflava]
MDTRNTITAITGMALLVLGAQGGIRLLVDHEDAGLLEFLPGGFAARLAVYLVAAVTGAVLAAVATTRAKRNGTTD